MIKRRERKNVRLLDLKCLTICLHLTASTEAVEISVFRVDGMVLTVDFASSCCNPSEYHLMCGETGQFYNMMTGCHSRWSCQCPECSKRWKRKVIRRFTDGIAAMKTPRFLTLTLTKKRAMWDNLDRLWDMRRELFIRLRKHGIKIRSWLGVIELPNHAHLVIDSDYIPWKLLSKIWHTVTGDSYIVDIRRINKKGHMIGYLVKYLGKTLGKSYIDPMEFKGFHIVQSWNVPPLPDLERPCPVCGRLHDAILISEDQFWADQDRHAADDG